MVWGRIVQYHDEFMDKYGDPRVKNFPLMGGPVPTILISVFYVIFSRYLGPKLMEKRQPFVLKEVLLVYNLVMVTLSAYSVYEGIRNGLMTTISLTCFPVDHSDSEAARKAVIMMGVYYFSKFVEMLDTIFFIMRKKMNQVSHLHIIHHGIMPITAWIGTKFFPGGQAIYWGFWNSFVHVIMYSYYLLAGLGPHMQKYLWWKKYLTMIQLTQFVMIWVHSTQVLFNGCNFSKLYSGYVSCIGVMFFYMFYQFYQDEYKKGGNSKKQALSKTANMCSPSASNGGNFYEDSDQSNGKKHRKVH